MKEGPEETINKTTTINSFSFFCSSQSLRWGYHANSTPLPHYYHCTALPCHTSNTLLFSYWSLGTCPLLMTTQARPFRIVDCLSINILVDTKIRVEIEITTHPFSKIFVVVDLGLDCLRRSRGFGSCGWRISHHCCSVDLRGRDGTTSLGRRGRGRSFSTRRIGIGSSSGSTGLSNSPIILW